MSTQTIMEWLDEVIDPELPVVSIVDLGIVREVRWSEDDGTLVISLTPTYSGCPATSIINDEVVRLLNRKGIQRVRVQTRLAPAWTTDWITARGHRRLMDNGIVPPQAQAESSLVAGPVVSAIVRCPRCKSSSTSEISRFGSTLCKALYRCKACLEPFDYVKVH